MAGKLGMGLLETLLENLDRDLNLADTTLTNPTITTSAYATFTGGIQNTHVVLTPAASVTMVKATHAGRICTIASTATANDEYVLPTAASVGESYRFVWSGVAADADDIIGCVPCAAIQKVTASQTVWDGQPCSKQPARVGDQELAPWWV